MDKHAEHTHGKLTRDPVCGMEVDVTADKPSTKYQDHQFYFCSKGCKSKFLASPSNYLTATDPVCGMTVDRGTAKHVHQHDDEQHYFCSTKCETKFKDNPENYLGDRPEPEPMPEGTIYTCPMHPEIEQVGPGTCPKCGMALEPMGAPSADEGPNPELVDFKRRFAIGAVLTLPLLVLTMGPMVGLPVRGWIGERLTLWIELILGTPVILWSGWPFLVRGLSIVRAP